MRQTIPVNEGGRRRKITKLQAAVTQLANKAAGGDARAIRYAVELTSQAEADERASATGRLSAEARRAKDQEILAAVAALSFSAPATEDAT